MKQLIKDYLSKNFGYEEDVLVEELAELIDIRIEDILDKEYQYGYAEGYAEGEKYGYEDGTNDALAHANIDEE